MTWLSGWDYLIESAKGWADSYIWFGIGCLALLAVFEIIERNARRKKQRHSLDRIRDITSKQRKADQRKVQPRRKTA
jgi:hypothetical protein